MKPYSMNEPYFGSLKRKYDQNKQMRIDGLAAQANEEQNGSFREGARLSKMNKLALLVLRKWSRGKREEVTAHLKRRRLQQIDRKMAVRLAHVEDMLEKAREQYARSMVEWNVDVGSLAEYQSFLADNKNTHTDKVQKTKTIYHAIRYGWGREQCHTCQSCTSKTTICGLGCTMKVHTGFGKLGHHGHMMQHVLKMLEMVENGTITKPRAPTMPVMEERPVNVSLGGRSDAGHNMTVARHQKWLSYMEVAKENPEKYSRWVTLPPQDSSLVGTKIEMRFMLDKLDTEGNPVKDTDGSIITFLHCFEGTIKEVKANDTGKSQRSNGLSSKWSIAKIEWDEEFLEWGAVTYNVLDPGLYAKEDKNGGWNIPNQEYLTAVQCAADKFEELRDVFKTKAAAGDEGIFLARLADMMGS